MSSDAEVEMLLLQLINPDTAAIKNAEAALKRVMKSANCVKQFMTQMECSQHIAARQLAAVLLRKKINQYWSRLAPGDQSEFKAALLRMLAREPERLVRKAVCGVVAAISKHLLPANLWNELLQYINQSTQSPDEGQRELSFLLFYSLTETVGDALQAHFDSLKNVFIGGLRDQSSMRVRVQALRAAGALIEYLSTEDHVLQFRELINPMVEVVSLCLEKGEEDVAIEFFDVFSELVESPLPVLTPSLPQLVQFLLGVIANDKLEDATRDAAAVVINNLATHKPKTLAKKTSIQEIVNVMVHLCAQDSTSAGGHFDIEEKDDDDLDEETRSPHSIAQQTLDTLALRLPKKYIFPVVHSTALAALSSPQPMERKAGCTLIGVIAEGCDEQLRERLDELLPLVLKCSEDPEPLVREGSCFALGQFSEHLIPDILEYHASILPAVFRMLDDSSPRVQGISCYVLESFCENLEKEAVMPYLEPLMVKLVGLLRSPNQKFQGMAIGAIAATAVAAEKEFIRFFEPIVDMMKIVLKNADESQLSLRGRAIECMGHMAIAVEEDAFRPHLLEIMTLAVQGLALEDPELSEYTFAFFCNAAKVFGEEFAPFLPQLVPHLLQASQISDGETITVKSLHDDHPALEGFDDDEDEDDEISGRVTQSVRTAMLDMKAASIEALGFLAEYTGRHFVPYIPRVLEVFTFHSQYFHETVRLKVAGALSSMVKACVIAVPVKFEIGQVVTLEPSTSAVVEQVIAMLANFLVDEEDKEVVAKSCEGVQKVVELVGPTAVAKPINELMKAILDLLQENALCQNATEDDDEEEVEHDRILTDALCDLIGGLAKAFGPSFDPLFRPLAPALVRFFKASRPSTDKVAAMGCLAEVLEALGETIVPGYVNDMVPLVIRDLGDKDHELRRNSAYCAGVLMQKGGAAVQPHFLSILKALRPLFNAKGAEAPAADNAASAVCKMIMASSASLSSLPLGQILPVLIGALPLKVDMDENETVYRCLAGLITQKQPDTMNFIPQIVSIYAQALDEESDVEGAAKEMILNSLRGLFMDFGEQMKAVVGSLPERERNNIMKHA